MDSTVAVVIIIGFFSIIAVAAFLIFRRRSHIDIKGPFGTGMELDASNEPDVPGPGVRVKDAKSREGGLVAEDSTGDGAEVEQVDTKDDILVSSKPPKEDTDPKADRPA